MKNDIFLQALDLRIKNLKERILSETKYYTEKCEQIALKINNMSDNPDWSGLNSLGEFQNIGQFEILMAELNTTITLRNEYIASQKIK